jgi:succinate-semialdehyde dehydrogenase/glutarate-semialdehyde dehydrogenase
MSNVEPIEVRMLINGEWRHAMNGQTLDVINPATEETVASVAFGGRSEARQALEAAAAALPAWSRATAWERAKILKRCADLMRERCERIARILTMEQGKPLAESRSEVNQAADTFEWFAEEAKRAYGEVIPESVATSLC